MRSFEPQYGILVLCLVAATVLASVDPTYDPSYNFRPQNVTGLVGIYDWIGSYYNATTTVEYTPLIGSTVNFSYSSVLAITQPGKNDHTHNPVSLVLGFWSSGFNFSTIPIDYAWTYEPPNGGIICSSNPEYMYRGTENSTITEPYFNLSLAETKSAPYNLSSILNSTDGQTLYSNLTSCDTSMLRNEWEVVIITDEWWNNVGWDWTYPVLNLQFDNSTANLTLDGYFIAYPYVLTNVSLSNTTREIDEAYAVQGKFKIRFSGVVDNYHSDVLVEDSPTPEWLRSVGFNNNSLNIGYNKASRSYGDHKLPENRSIDAIPDMVNSIIRLLFPEAWASWDDYAVPGGTFRENCFSEPESSRLHPSHHKAQYTWKAEQAELPFYGKESVEE
ncbi:hypothetical protein BGW36DRAFT_354333 [Talaromyces proteolyticus]|uniref:Uncharacterized protein n=1 Tax=Talaromyces proteolyticus TaxID=1131652 RepID=A0AAD4L6C6_9EURO|nr:uncharacterized protein BGW36DRAFT_354333 [Talaromyces proteolyticus]KAH8705946.1 hypothetical protein BGW36DRAFT_354333 [Talaromyces proteolyticus]